MRTNNALPILLLSALALSACATHVPAANVPLAIQCPVLPPPPASVMVERPASFRSELLNFFSEKPVAPIPSLNSSQPANR